MQRDKTGTDGLARFGSRQPSLAAPATEKTEVWVAFDDDHRRR